MTATTAPDPPEFPGVSSPSASSSVAPAPTPPREREEHKDPEPTEYQISSGATVVSLAPTKCDDHEALLIKLPPPRTSADSSVALPASVNLSKPRRRSSVDPPEVLEPIDEFQTKMPEEVPVPNETAPLPAIPDDETIEQMSAALALVPYDDTPQDPEFSTITTPKELYEPIASPCPSTITTENPNALVIHDPKKHRSSNQQMLVPYDPQPSTKSPDYPMRRGFDHCFISVPTKERLSALFATLRRNAERKVIVIFSTCESAQFHSLLFRQLELFTVYEMQENMPEVDIIDSHDRFLYTYPGVLFASDIALREFDIPPNVDYILQYEPPMSPTEYIYRFSSAKLFETSCHKALLFLSPEGKEMNFITYFQDAGVELSELQARKVSQFQPRVEKMVLKHTTLNEAAWKAFRAHVAAYESHTQKDVWDKKSIDEEAILKSFAMPHFPSPNGKEEKIVKELIAKSSKGERVKKEEKHHHHGKERREKENPHASWMEGKERTWRSGQKKAWMTKQKSWRHAHSTSGLNSAADRS